MELSIEDLKEGQSVWACAYSTNNTEKTMALRKKPVLGIIKKDKVWKSGVFYELKRSGELKKSSGVKIDARHYANTEEESKKIYNTLVQEQINKLEELINICKGDLI